MKTKIIVSFIAATLWSAGAFAQLKVFGDGKVAIGGVVITDSRVQVNIEQGDQSGFQIKDSPWNEVKFKVTTDEFNSYLSGWAHYPKLSMLLRQMQDLISEINLI